MKDMDMEKCFFGEGAIKQRGSITGGLLFAWQCRKGGSQKMILYFSATGNGKYIAEQIAEKTDEKCMSIVDCICEDKYCSSNEKIFGMVVPTYFWRLPRIVAEYLGKLRIENCGYTFFLASYGTTTGEAGSMAKKIMAHNGQNFDAYYSVIMPDTWTPVFDLSLIHI